MGVNYKSQKELNCNVEICIRNNPWMLMDIILSLCFSWLMSSCGEIYGFKGFNLMDYEFVEKNFNGFSFEKFN